MMLRLLIHPNNCILMGNKLFMVDMKQNYDFHIHYKVIKLYLVFVNIEEGYYRVMNMIQDMV